MTQCHDLYEAPSGPPGLRLLSDTADDVPCHDEYPAETAGTSSAAAAHGCEVREHRQGEVRFLRVTGRLDWATAPDLLAHLRLDCTEPGVVVDLLGTDLDAAGTGALLAAAAVDLRRHQQLVVITGHPEYEVLLAERFAEIATLVTTERAALRFLRDRGLDVGREEG